MRPIYKIADNKEVSQKTPAPSSYLRAPLYSDEASRFFHSKSENGGEEIKPRAGGKLSGLNTIKDLINAFEGKSTQNATPNGVFFRSRSKSIGNLAKASSAANKKELSNSCKLKDVINVFESKSTGANGVRIDHKAPSVGDKLVEIDEIKEKTIFLQTKIENYVHRDGVTYVEHQNEIVNLLAKIGEIESDGNHVIKKEKQKCVRMVQNCNALLTAKIEGERKIEEREPIQPAKELSTSLYLPEVQQNGIPNVSVLRNIFESNGDVASHERYVPYKEHLEERRSLAVELSDEDEAHEEAEEEANNGDDKSDSTLVGEGEEDLEDLPEPEMGEVEEFERLYQDNCEDGDGDVDIYEENGVEYDNGNEVD